MNPRFLNALACKNQGRPPIWLMRQAGRYMPAYRALREKYSFLEMCHQPELSAHITELPIQEFGFDAAILFSDILVIAEAFDVGLRFEEKVGPIIERPVRTSLDVENLPRIDVGEKLVFVKKAIEHLKTSLKVPLIGFCGAPFTVASYMIEGGSSKTLHRTKKWMLSDPLSFHKLLDRITESTIDYLHMQIEAGVDALQIFDSWANYLAFPQFLEFSKSYLEKILKSLKSTNIPILIFCKGSSAFAPELAKLLPSGISIDWNGHLPHIRKQIPLPIALQGNLDPDTLYATPDSLRHQVANLLTAMQGDPGYIFNLGHGIQPDTPMDAVKILVEMVHR